MKNGITEKKLLNMMIHAADALAEIDDYKGWKEKTIRQEIKTVLNRLKEAIGTIDLDHLSENEAKMLGFHRWDSSGLLLIPFYLKNMIKNGNTVYDIEGNMKIWGVDKIDNDERFGMLAYGFYPNGAPEKDKVKEEA